jgi:lipopolysaccharide transport system ATP-binding protein
MSSEIAIKVDNLSKCYAIYERPQDRLKQMVLGKLNSLTGQARKQYYREFWALKDISFEVKKGQTVGIIGRNGSGKSTLLQMICGTLNPTSGSVTTHGRVAALLELGSGFNPEFTGRENVYLNASVLGLTHAETVARFDKITAFADIGDFIDQPVKTYSSGMMLRLAFAVIAHVDADILIIDEALAVGDAFFTQKCMRFIRKFKKNHAILFVSHDTGSVRSLCDEAVWINQGQMQEMGDVELVTKRYGTSIQSQIQDDEIRVQNIEASRNPAIAANGNMKLNMGNSTATLFENLAFSEGWKTGHAEIFSVRFGTSDGQDTHVLEGGEQVVLRIRARCLANLKSPILGFFVKDKSGQSLFGEHTYTYTDKPLYCKAGDQATAMFKFQLPHLPNGEYAMTISIADGDPYVHTQHHWLHDAIIFRVESNRLRYGLMGIAFDEVTLVKHHG